MTLRVQVAFAAPGVELMVPLDLPDGSAVGVALDRARGLAPTLPAGAELEASIFGVAAALSTPLRDGDRVELTRPLQADPKSARRNRALLRGDAG